MMKVFFLTFFLCFGGSFVQGEEVCYHSVNVIEGDYQEREIDLTYQKNQVVRSFSKEKGWEFNFPGIFSPAKEKLDGHRYDKQGYLVATEDGLTVTHRSFPWRSVTLRSPEGKEAVYYYYWEGNRPLISQVKSPTQPDIRYEYFTHSDGKPAISSRKESEGRYVLNEYDGGTGKVIRQLAPIGGDTAPFVKNYFTYHPFVTDTYDALGGKTTYYYDQDKRITAIEQYDEENIVKTERIFWDAAGNLSSKVYENSAGVAVKAETFEYDAKNRLFQIKIYGNITGKHEADLKVDAQGKPENQDCDCYLTRYVYNADGKMEGST